MNFRLVFNQLSLLLIVLSVCMMASDIASWLMKLGVEQARATEHHARVALFVAAVSGAILGSLLWRITRGSPRGFGRPAQA